LLRIGVGLQTYERRQRIITTPPKAMAKSEKVDGSGIIKTLFKESEANFHVPTKSGGEAKRDLCPQIFKPKDF